MTITKRPFGMTGRGEAVTAYELESAGGTRAVILDYGATVQSLIVPDAAGRPVDVVLGYDTVAEYEKHGGYLGATIGRFGNRIAGARFSLGGKEYLLEKNDGENHLHGGKRGFDKYVWDVSVGAAQYYWAAGLSRLVDFVPETLGNAVHPGFVGVGGVRVLDYSVALVGQGLEQVYFSIH